MCSVDIFLGLLALLFPPLPVWVKCGICSADSLINILLCFLGFIPGLLHAWYIIAKHPDPSYEYENLPQHVENGRVTYVIVQPQPHGAPKPYNHHAQYQQQQQQQQGQDYGTVNNASAAGSSSAPQQQTPQHDDGAVPPSYAEAVGDHKVQTRD